MTSTFAINPTVLSRDAEDIARIARGIADCDRCTFRKESDPVKRRLCYVHRRMLPKKLRCNLARFTGDQYAAGAPSPEVAQATLTRKARNAKRVLQMQRRSGVRGLLHALKGSL